MFGFNLKGYNTIRMYTFLAERFLPYWFNKYTKCLEWPIVYCDINKTIMKKIKFKSFKKKSGTLIPFSLKRDFPIKVKRIFLINGRKNFVRGDHAHKKCSQFIYLFWKN